MSSVLKLLLDENLSPKIPSQVQRHQPAAVIECMQEWEGGVYLGAADELILRAAHQQKLTLVTYDSATIPSILERMSEQNLSHSGVIFINQRTIPSEDLGTLVLSICAFWKRHRDLDWTNLTAHLIRVRNRP